MIRPIWRLFLAVRLPADVRALLTGDPVGNNNARNFGAWTPGGAMGRTIPSCRAAWVIFAVCSTISIFL